MAGENLRKIHPGSAIILKLLFFNFSIESLSTILRDRPQILFPMASTSCEQSVDIVSGLYSENEGE